MEIFRNLTDDQLALLGCATALVLSGMVMALSYFIGRARRDVRLQDARLQKDRLQTVLSASVPENRDALPKQRRVA